MNLKTERITIVIFGNNGTLAFKVVRLSGHWTKEAIMAWWLKSSMRLDMPPINAQHCTRREQDKTAFYGERFSLKD